MAIPLVVGSAGLVAAIGVGTHLVLQQRVVTSHRITLPAQAAGMTRDRAQEPRFAAQVAAVRDGYQLRFMGRLGQFESGVYQHRLTAQHAPAGPLVFVGATVDTAGDPRDFVAGLTRGARAEGYTATPVDLGPGAEGVCLTPANAAAGASPTCAWSTGDSTGQVVAMVPGWDVPSLGALTRALRSEVETPIRPG